MVLVGVAGTLSSTSPGVGEVDDFPFWMTIPYTKDQSS